MQLDAFPHLAGIHCSSSSIADILRYDGQALSEAMVFGLGSGLGFISSSDPRHAPRYRFNGRALDLEGKFYALFGVHLPWAGRWDPGVIERALRQGRPVIAQTDIAYLPYYDGVHFPLHGIVVTGWDGEHARVADTYSNDLQAIDAAQLRDALAGQGSPFMEERPFRFAPAPRIEAAIDAETLTRAILVAAREMLEPAVAGTGIPAMRALAADRAGWRDSPDWAWSARFAYQGIEKRGTGGGGFRRLYAAFLEESSPILPAIGKLRAIDRMRDSAGRWSAMAQDLKGAFVGQDRSGIEAAAERLEAIAVHETALMADLRDAIAR
ncbi:MAG TPA: DUF4872 domain-containing protein [Usitatibacter sp.]|nr:DUF4872 domain-containing protein [Usitatibacter sp.]